MADDDGFDAGILRDWNDNGSIDMADLGKTAVVWDGIETGWEDEEDESDEDEDGLPRVDAKPDEHKWIDDMIATNELLDEADKGMNDWSTDDDDEDKVPHDPNYFDEDYDDADRAEEHARRKRSADYDDDYGDIEYADTDKPDDDDDEEDYDREGYKGEDYADEEYSEDDDDEDSDNRDEDADDLY